MSCVIPTLMRAMSDRLIYIWLHVWGTAKKGYVSAFCKEGLGVTEVREVRGEGASELEIRVSAGLAEIRSYVMTVDKNNS